MSASGSSESARTPVAIEPEALRRLSARRDGPGLLHLGLQLAAFLSSAWATASLAALDDARWGIAATLCAASVLSFFPTLHESGHRTAFATRWLNELAVWLGALFMLQAPSFFREFHREHHRSTQDRDKDPEISGAPRLLDPWPSNPFTYLFLASGQLLMVGKLGFTAACALLPRSIWAPLFPFVRRDRARRVAWESRATLLVLATATGLGFAWIPAFASVLLAWPLAHLGLGLYLMPEHTGLPNGGSQLERTRSFPSHAVVRALMWNMPYHAEHHLHPGIPFHALPEAHRALRDRLVHTSPGLLRFHFEAIRRAFGAG